jgi:hypothetical protein
LPAVVNGYHERERKTKASCLLEEEESLSTHFSFINEDVGVVV